MSFLKDKYLAITIGGIEVDLSRSTKVFLFSVSTESLATDKQTLNGGNIPTSIQTAFASHSESLPVSATAEVIAEDCKWHVAHDNKKFVVEAESGALNIYRSVSHTAMVIRTGDFTLDKALVEKLSPEIPEAIIPDVLSVTIRDVLLATSDSAKVLSADFGAKIDLTGLPLVGRMIPKELDFGIEYLQILFAKNIDQSNPAYLNNINNVLPPGVHHLPQSIQEGLNFSAVIKIGDEAQVLSLASLRQLQGSGGAGDAQSTSRAPIATQTPGSQENVNKTFGPVHIQSISMDFKNGSLDFIIDASIAFGPLSMAFQELKVGTAIDHFAPVFGLEGLAVDFHGPPVTIGGAFLHDGNEYSGMATMSLKKVELTAYGSYAKVNGDTSLFIYGLLDYPLGGPPFFFVTGLAATFGFNRDLIAPPVSQVSQFPLVKAAVGSKISNRDPAGRFMQMLQEIDVYIPAKWGEFFLGVGIKFMSFEVINSLLLLIGKFGRQLEFDLFGLSRYIAPDPNDPSPVAVVELELLGRYKPDEGSVLVRGQLTPNSYVFSKDCHLSGGYAYAFWTSGPHEGDFVYAYGGYGTHYTPPAHYPQNIPALTMHWQVNRDLSLKGGGYWAITPRLITAGVHMHASYNVGWFRAWFDLDAYFLISWKPSHYEAGFHVDFGLSVRIHFLFFTKWIGFDISADLKIHGPPFGGEASLHLWVCTLHIGFGKHSSTLPPLLWDEFRNAFLPEDKQMVNITLAEGLVKTIKDQHGKDVWVVNPKDIRLETNSIIPSSSYQASYKGNGQTNDTNKVPIDSVTYNRLPIASINEPGIAPMEIGYGGFTSEHIITIEGPSETCELKGVGLTQNSPKAIWGNTRHADSGNDALVANTLTGFQLVPGKPPKAGVTHAVSKQTLAWDLDVYGKAFQWKNLETFTAQTEENVNQYIESTQTARTAVLDALGFTTGEVPAVNDLKNDLQYKFVPNLMTGTFTAGNTNQ